MTARFGRATVVLDDLDGSTPRELLAGAIRWARKAGYERTMVPHTYRSRDRLTEVAWQPDQGYLAVFKSLNESGGPVDPLVSAATVTSTRQAIDVLVALDVLPDYFSSSYYAGRASVIVTEWLRGAAPC